MQINAMEMVLCQEKIIMWFVLKKRIDIKLQKKIIKSYLNYDNESENRHFNSRGKKFLGSHKGIIFIKPLLESLKDQLFNYYDDPVIDHFFVLSKSQGGNETPAHQDFIYWTKKEKSYNPKKMITFWLPLIDVNEENGSLKLVESESAESIKFLNKGNEKHHKHFSSVESRGFNWNIAKPPNLSSVNLKAGNWLAFDSYSSHASNPNNSQKARLALKIVVGEKKLFNPVFLGRLNVRIIINLPQTIAILYLFLYFKFRKINMIIKKLSGAKGN